MIIWVGRTKDGSKIDNRANVQDKYQARVMNHGECHRFRLSLLVENTAKDSLIHPLFYLILSLILSNFFFRMDFRSQLSAFQSGGGGNSRGGGGSDRSPQRSPNDRGYGNSTTNHYGRGGGGGSGGNDRRRPRDSSPYQGRGLGGPPQARRRFNSPDRDGLGDLRHHGYRIPRGHPPPPTEQEKKQKPKHIALLLVCIDDLPYEHIWREWCETIQSDGDDDYHISLLCHAKYPQKVKSEWLKQRLLVYPPKSGRGNSYLDPEFLSRIPNWGSIEITRAMLDLLQAGLKIGNDPEKDARFSSDRFVVRRPVEMGGRKPLPVDQFLYISETCLPIATAQEFFKSMDNTMSWVNARHRKDPGTPKNAYENDQFGMINRRIPGQYRWKADQWVLLCRSHASQIIGIDRPHIPHKYHLWHSYRDINASDEMYIPTSLALLGLLRFTSEGEDTQRLRGTEDTPKSEGNSTVAAAATTTISSPVATPANTFEFVKKRAVTYTDWTQGMRNPATFANGLVDFQKVARLARDKGCLVARKFAPFIVLPGVAKEDLDVTGQMSAEQWRQEIEKLVLEQPQKKVETSETIVIAAAVEQPGVTEEKEQDNKADDDDESGEETFLARKGNVITSRSNDDDDEENQLE